MDPRSRDVTIKYVITSKSHGLKALQPSTKMPIVAYHQQVKGATSSKYHALCNEDALMLHPYFYYTHKNSITFSTRGHLYLRGLHVLPSHQCLMDIEFADDTAAIYIQADVENLKKLESGLSLFCERSITMINWYKSCTIWFFDESHLAWCPSTSFTWINQGVSTKYSGFQIGFNIPPQDNDCTSYSLHSTKVDTLEL